MRSGYIVAGAGTDIGKTHISCGLLRLWREQGLSCAALKPVLSGVEDGAPNDATRLIEALGQEPTPEAVAVMSPWRFSAPLAPPAAAALEGRALDFEAVVRVCQSALANGDAERVLIETAGGVMSPLTERHTMLDLIERLGAPVIFVAGSYLGAVSHTLTGLAALGSRKCEIAALVISESEQTAGELMELPVMLRRQGATAPIAVVRRGAGAQNAEDLSRLDLA